VKKLFSYTAFVRLLKFGPGKNAVDFGQVLLENLKIQIGSLTQEL
jgi:hypothetical protein